MGERKKGREREMAQPPPWKAMYLYVTSEARDGCDRAKQSVNAARGALASPEVLDTRDAEGRYTLLQSAVTHVEHASDSLSGFIVNAMVAEHLALHGCGAVPSQPVARVGDLRDHHDYEWLGLIRLEAAREHAQDALRGVEGAFTLVDSVRFMLLCGNPDAAGRREATEGQLRAAALELQAVVMSVENMSALASFAIRDRIQ